MNSSHQLRTTRTSGGIYLTEKYQCAICGHEYDAEKGEPLQNIPPGRVFASLPDDWQCPVCGAAKQFFNRSCD